MLSIELETPTFQISSLPWLQSPCIVHNDVLDLMETTKPVIEYAEIHQLKPVM